MLGQLYTPKGYALETAQAVLQETDVAACNVAAGCDNQCTYCYGPKFSHCTREEWFKVRFPKEPPAKLIFNQLRKNPPPKGVFFSFLTDPLSRPGMKQGQLEYTKDAIDILPPGVKVAVLSKTTNHWKLGPDQIAKVRHGATIVSMDDAFWHEFEPYSMPPNARRENLWWLMREYDAYTWISMEPYPPQSIYRQDITKVLDQFLVAHFIIFGKWNYDLRASTPAAKAEYKADVEIIRNWSQAHDIPVHIKSETLKFIGEIPGE